MNQKGFANIILVIVIVIFLGVVGYFVFVKKSGQIAQQPTSTPTQAIAPTKTPVSSNEPVTYTKNDQLFTVSKKEFVVSNKFTVAELRSQSQECGTNKIEQYFVSLLSKYTNSDKGIEYSFQYLGQTQDSGLWTVIAIPNKPGYSNVGAFKQDFNICAAGADKYPTLVSQNYLLFTSACGTGYDDSSGKPHGCDLVKQFVEPTIKLK